MDTEKLNPYWKVRIVVNGGILHVGSSTQPRVIFGNDGWTLDISIIEDYRYGDTIGLADWSKVQWITWRYSE